MTSSTPAQLYVVALGSNRRGRHGAPEAELRAALAAIGGVVKASPIIATAPLGPARRRFANAAALVESAESPPALLARLKRIERDFGRRRGRRWDMRVIDLDIILWSGGAWASPGLVIPHPQFRRRGFVLQPLNAIVPDWRDPLSGRTVRQLAARGAI
ncbi:2-amino-4-hydroxy-6-hydroxymethyldihydropteridine diphosphokinase [Sphingomonas sp. BT-65]|uniref:2-amino-4-hydroxy-6- hydroxymethyldihydropteridine diphosphokinase n=1 Tax=Sphingomonas sp. BT-65 TaxID=2989821 RepID=UPI00223629B5|nr:2-amino-4-hydroxy-6-hydroxymethyldihydropteridine diphosphokinase [Sphingomonas sp. BT-65]MCW4462609.1 2-amino-4-hydroxy-6-hydroxymethyldihydropteridine diphosphokinase [Sphingomonas sp. BT-65]